MDVRFIFVAWTLRQVYQWHTDKYFSHHVNIDPSHVHEIEFMNRDQLRIFFSNSHKGNTELQWRYMSFTVDQSPRRLFALLFVQGCTVYPKKYAHGFCFAVLCCGYTLTDFPISIRLTSLALWQSNDCPSASKATLMNMDKYFMWIHYERLHNHNKAKHNKTVCIFLGIYCITETGKFRVTIPSRGEFTVHRWIPSQRASNVGFVSVPWRLH